MLTLNTHAPDVGHASDCRREYCNQIKQILYRAKRKDFVIRETDNNGQVSRNPDSGDKIIGKWPIATEMDSGDGGNPPTQCQKTNYSLQTSFLPIKSGEKNLAAGPTAMKPATYKLTT